MNFNFSGNWWETELILGNTAAAYAYALAAFLAALALLHVVKNVGVTRLKAFAATTETDLDDLLIAMLGKFQWFEYQLVAFLIASRYLTLSAGFNRGLKLVILMVFTYRAITIAQGLLTYWINKVAAKRELEGQARTSVVRSTQVIMRILVWVAAVLFVLDNLGINISAVLAGLGIGGVAVALASQAILGDLFNFFVILLDKPFKVGEFIVAEPVVGTVEHIGLKSTRIRSLSGELMIVANTRLLAMELKNFKHMERRRVVIKTGVVYQTPLEKLKKIPELVSQALAEVENTKLDRCNLAGLGNFSMDFETVYYLESADYNLHMAAQEKFLQGLIARFQAEGIEFAYPTQTLFINK